MLSLALCCSFAFQEPEFNGLKLKEWVAMATDDPVARKRRAALIALGQLLDKDTKDTVLTTAAKVLRRDSQAMVRQQAIGLLAQQPADTLAGYLADLTEALRTEKDPGVKREIAAALGRLGGAATGAVLPLIDGLKDDASVKIACAEALGRIGKPAADAAPALMPLLDDANREVKRAGVFALARIEAEDTAAVARGLTKVLKECIQVDLDQRPHAGLAGSIACREKPHELLQATLVAILLVKTAHPQLGQLTLLAADDIDPEIRKLAVQALGLPELASAESKPIVLLKLKSDVDGAVRAAAARSLVVIMKDSPKLLASVFAEILPMEKDAEPKIAMITAMGGLGAEVSKEDLKVLRDCLRDKLPSVRDAAVVAIQRINKSTQVKPENKPNP